MGACDRAPVCAVGHVQVMRRDDGQRRGRGRSTARMPMPTRRQRFRCAIGRRRLQAAQGLPRRRAHARGHHQGGERCGTARARRRRLSDRPQMDAGARRAGAAPDGGERRRGRARHLQGPLLSRAGSAPLHRRHADRRLDGGGGGDLHLHPRRISRSAADARRGDRQGGRGRPRRIPSCISAAAPAPISAAKNPR